VKAGDLVRIKLQFKCQPQEVVGTVLSIKPNSSHVAKPLQPGPVYEVKILTSEGSIWESWIDQRDQAEILQDHSPVKIVTC